MPVNVTADTGEQSVGGPRYMQTVVDLTGNQLRIRTHLVTHMTFAGFHGLVAVTLADPANRTIYVAQPYLDGIGSQFNNPNGRWVEHTETVPDAVAADTNRIDILQCWHGVNMLSKDLQIFWKEFGSLIIAIVGALLGGGSGGNGGGQQPVSADSAVAQISQKMTDSGGHVPLHTQQSGFYQAPTTGGVITGVPYYLTAKHSGRCLDVSGASKDNGARVQQWDWLGGANQRWVFTDVGDGAYKLTVQHSGKVLDVGGLGDHTATGNGLQQWDWCNGNNQKFRLRPVGDGTFAIVAVHSGKVLDVGGPGDHTGNGCPVNQWDWWGGDNQKWYLHRVADRLHR